MDLFPLAQAQAPVIAALRRDIHAHPELGRSEYRTQQVIMAFLETLGLAPKAVADTGVMAVLEGALPGPTVALRADIDALPLTEATGLPFSSENAGVMHACGHDIHTAALLGAAQLLTSVRDQLPGKVVFLFQPDEEMDGGAARMIAEGCLEGVEAVFGAHVSPDLPTGHFGFRAGRFYAAASPFKITLSGRASHGAEPHHGLDTIPAACALVQGLQTLVTRRLSPTEPAVITVGSFHAGTQNNIIADTAELTGIMRCFGLSTRAFLQSELEKMVRGVAESYGLSYTLRAIDGYPGVINDTVLTVLAKQAVAEISANIEVADIEEPTLTTEDFGCFAEAAPICFYHIGVGHTDGTENFPLHNPAFSPDDAALPVAAAAHVAIVMKYLASHA